MASLGVFSQVSLLDFVESLQKKELGALTVIALPLASLTGSAIGVQKRPSGQSRPMKGLLLGSQALMHAPFTYTQPAAMKPHAAAGKEVATMQALLSPTKCIHNSPLCVVRTCW